MRPYLAIVKDSFVEALASRVLWILLVLITLVLLAVIPLGFRGERMTEFRQGDFLNARGVARAMSREFELGEPSPGLRIWSQFDEPARRQFTDFARESTDRSESYFADLRKLIEQLNQLLEQPDLYEPVAWQGVQLPGEARELLEQGIDNLGREDLARLNRLLIETPYLEHFRPQPPKQIFVTYFGGKVSPPIRVSERRIKQFIEQLILPGLIGFLVGAVGVLAAILVTAPIIPQMFDPGSLSLLLSKPVSRSLMFLAKFLGGCAFILINVTYLIAGLWLIVGVRFDIWNAGLLWCIPIFLFLFAIYYSVSALAGVIWRNAVVSVVLTVVFWLACQVVGVTKAIFEQVTVESRRFVRMVEVSDTLLAVDEQGAAYRWAAETNDWQSVFLEQGGRSQGSWLGPIADDSNQIVFAARGSGRSFFRSGSTLVIGKASEDWNPIEGPSLPEGTFALLPDPRGRVMAVTNTGIERFTGELDAKPQKLELLFFEIPLATGKPFEAAGPADPLKITPPATAAIDPVTAAVAIYSRGTIWWLRRDGDAYVLEQTVDVETDPDLGASLAVAGSTLLLALEDGRILDYEFPSLRLRCEQRPEPASQPRFACASPDGNWFAILFHNGRLHVRDPQGTLRLANVRGQTDISAVHFSSRDALLVADRTRRITRYQLESFARDETFAPPLTAMEIAYYYAIVPIYTVFPKPSELDNTVQYVVSREETMDLGLQNSDLQGKRVRLRPWAPVRSSLAFTLVVLLLACVYIERQDF